MWVLPTFGRPARCQEALDAILAMGCGTPGIVIVDGDPDPAYAALRLPEGWELLIHPENVGLLGVLNRFFAEHPDLPWYGLLTDDAMVRTEGWDKHLVAAAGPFGIASCNDGWRPGERIAGAVVFGGGLLRAWGWWGAPGLWHTYGDDAWEEIARGLGNWVYCADVLVEHQHPFNGKAAIDRTHERSYSRLEADRRRFAALREAEIPAAIERAAQVMGSRAPEAERIRQRLRRIRSRSVMIATPVHRETAWQYAQALAGTFGLLAQQGVKAQILFVAGSSNLPRARNELCAWFLASDCTDLIFIDADMGWQPGDLLRLLASDKPVIGGVGRKKTDPITWCLRFRPGSETALVQDEMGAVEVARLGTGFLKIAREALEEIAAAHPGLSWAGDPGSMPEEVRAHAYRFFRFGDADEGEDYEFCKLWQSVGGSIWVDPTIRLVHVGDKEYSGRLSDILVPAAPMQEAAD